MARVRLGLELGLGLQRLYKSPRISSYLARPTTTQQPGNQRKKSN